MGASSAEATSGIIISARRRLRDDDDRSERSSQHAGEVGDHAQQNDGAGRVIREDRAQKVANARADRQRRARS